MAARVASISGLQLSRIASERSMTFEERMLRPAVTTAFNGDVGVIPVIAVIGTTPHVGLFVAFCAHCTTGVRQDAIIIPGEILSSLHNFR